jgi:hypothetical protein
LTKFDILNHYYFEYSLLSYIKLKFFNWIDIDIQCIRSGVVKDSNCYIMEKKTKTLTIFIFLFVIILVFFLLNNRLIDDISGTTYNVNYQQLVIIYQENCARCHGINGEGDVSLRGGKYSVDDIKQIIRDGSDLMPAFTNIKEPFLSELAKYVHNL